MSKEIETEQALICEKYGVPFFSSPENLKVGIALTAKNRIAEPLNGLRHLPDGDTTGWYIWGGEWSDADDFFVPLHVEHLKSWCPDVLKFLGLPPGHRFLLGENNYEDVWYDAKLLEI